MEYIKVYLLLLLCNLEEDALFFKLHTYFTQNHTPMCVKLQGIDETKKYKLKLWISATAFWPQLYFSFLAAHTLLLAHGKAWHVYDEEFRKTQKGKVSIVLNADWHFPQKNEDVFLEAAKRGMEFFLGWFANPIYVNGDYPEVMKTLIAKHSKMEGTPNRYIQKQALKDLI